MSIRLAHITRGRRLSSLTLLLSLLSVAAAPAMTGCTKTDPKPDPTASTTPKPAQPIPSDFVMNDFFVGDAGAPGASGANGATAANGGAADDAVDPSGGLAPAAAGAPAAHPTLKLVDPGADPKTKRRYALTTGRADTMKFTLQTTLAQQAGPQKQNIQQPPIVLTMTVTPTAKSPDGVYSFSLKLLKADVTSSPSDPPQVAQAAKQMGPQLAALVGTTGSFTMDARGSLGQFTMGAGTNPAFAEVTPLIQQALEGAVVEFPEEPIGKGAHWQESNESDAEGVKAKVTVDATLADVTGDNVSVTVKTTRSAPPQPVPDPRAPKGTTVAIDGSATSNVTTHLDHLVKKAQGESMTKATIVETAPPPGAPGAAAKGGPQTSTQTISVKQQVEGS